MTFEILFTVFCVVGVFLGIKTIIEDYKEGVYTRSEPTTKAPEKRPTNINHDPEGIFCCICGQKHNPFFKCVVPWVK